MSTILPDPQTQNPPQSRTSNKGACGFSWGPGCDSNPSPPDDSHLCQLGKGHTVLQCECFYCGLKQVNNSRARV